VHNRGMPGLFAEVVTVVALVALAALTGCGGDDDGERGATASAATTGPVATTAPAAVPAAPSGGEVVRLIVTPEAGIAPDALGEQLADAIGADLAVVDVQRASLVVTVPADRLADVEAAAGVAAVQPDVAEPAD
jgi:hypothetical protein